MILKRTLHASESKIDLRHAFTDSIQVGGSTFLEARDHVLFRVDVVLIHGADSCKRTRYSHSWKFIAKGSDKVSSSHNLSYILLLTHGIFKCSTLVYNPSNLLSIVVLASLSVNRSIII